MPITFAIPSLTNKTQIAGFQGDVRTAALNNGGYVSAWESGISGTYTVYFQRHDALGNHVGAVTEVVTTGSIENQLYDIAVATNGTFSILTRGRIGNLSSDHRLVVQSFSETTGGPTAAPTVLNTAGLSPLGISGGQLLVNPAVAGSLIVAGLAIDAAFNNDLVRAVVTTAGVISSAPAAVNQNVTGSSDLVEMVGAPNGTEFTATSSSIVGTDGTPALPTNLKDMISIAPGVVVTASNTAAASEVTLTMRAGNDSAITTYGFSGAVVGTLILGGTVTGSQSFAIELVNLGGGRILIVWVADSGDSFNVNAHTDGVYAQVYNMNDGAAEGNATLIRGFGTGSNDGLLADIDISADLMADGRVALGLSYPNGLTGQDVFSTVLDPRNAGVTVVSSSTFAEIFVGTEFNDTFTGISTGDQIFGGAGVDTVAFFAGSNTARSVDLQTPGSFPSNSFVLSGIENLTGSGGTDLFRGDGAANLLSGLSGNDSLYGRDGNDSLLGGAGDDLLSGGNGGDLLVGSTGNDTLSGGAGDDLMFGDSGDDILVGGAGDDEMWGGDGLDTLRAEMGADLVYGGADNDTIFAHVGVGLVDGGTGIDTLRISGALAANTAGVHVDLTGMFDLLGLAVPLTQFIGDIIGIENVTGGTGNDFITGDGQVNVLRSGAGNDTLVSGDGADRLFGGAGADLFVFTGTTGGADELRDFDFSADLIGLVDGAFGDINSFNIGSRLTINATGTVGATAVAQLIFDNAGAGFGQLLYDADGNGAGAGVLLATLTPTTGTLVAINAADFLFI